ncbi:hypothetical protein ACN28S_57385 [Cystobacter fuscus]
MRTVGRAWALLVALSLPALAGDGGTPEPARFAWPKLQVLEQVESNEIVEAGGVPVALRAVHVKESARELVQRFADAFRNGGLYVPPGKAQPQLASNAAMLTAVDPRRRITYTVILQPQPDGTTTLYLGEANHALARARHGDGLRAVASGGAGGVAHQRRGLAHADLPRAAHGRAGAVVLRRGTRQGRVEARGRGGRVHALG